MSQKEYPRHWKCKKCGKDSPIEVFQCVNLQCRADLTIYGEVVFEGAQPPAPKQNDFLIETDPEEEEKPRLRHGKGWVIALVAVVLLAAAAWMLRPVLFDHEAEPTQPVTTEPTTTAPTATEPTTTAPTATEPTTTEPATTEPPHQHTFSSAWETSSEFHWHAATCQHSNLVSDMEAHRWDGGKVVSQSTHTAEGKITYTCTLCGVSKLETLPADSSHVFDQRVVEDRYLASPATQSSPAKYYVSCVCGERGMATFPYGEAVSPLPRDFSIGAGYYHTVGLKSDGTVVAVGRNDFGQSNVSDWKDIVVISGGYYHTVGVKSDGTVVAVGENSYGKLNVSNWKDIVVISARFNHTVGLKSDGTVVAVGLNKDGQCNVSGWKDIVAISAGGHHTVGLKSDGTVVAVGSNKYGQCDVDYWRDIVAISAGYNHTVGLKSDGTVVAVGLDQDNRCDVSDWKNIVAIIAGGGHTVGLKSNGTVVAVGYNEFDQCNVSGWKDIVAISAHVCHTVGLKADGTVVAMGWNEYGQCDVAGKWRNIKLPQR